MFKSALAISDKLGSWEMVTLCTLDFGKLKTMVISVGMITPRVLVVESGNF